MAIIICGGKGDMKLLVKKCCKCRVLLRAKAIYLGIVKLLAALKASWADIGGFIQGTICLSDCSAASWAIFCHRLSLLDSVLTTCDR